MTGMKGEEWQSEACHQQVGSGHATSKATGAAAEPTDDAHKMRGTTALDWFMQAPLAGAAPKQQSPVTLFGRAASHDV
jgi:hypothetical protein